MYYTLPEELSNIELYYKKKRFIEVTLLKDGTIQSNISLVLNYHGIVVNVECSRIEILYLIKRLVPSHWIISSLPEKYITLSIFSHHDFGMQNAEWEDEESPECIIQNMNDGELAIQRDFSGIMIEDKIVAILNEDISDGFYNLLRWFMPRMMLESGKTVLHSACIVNNGEASFFLGHSGFGKSTLTELAENRIVLGDDMNILSKNGNSYNAEGAALGGLYDNHSILNKNFPVKAFYWLHKSSNNTVEMMDKAEAVRKFISSCANIFWGISNRKLENQVMNLAVDMSYKYPFYNLYFSLDKGFWKYV